MNQINLFNQAVEQLNERYHNTTELEGVELASRKAKARKQDDIILDVFLRHSASLLSPEAVWNMTGQRYPLTSVRRAITNLTKAGHLTKTDQKRLGMYGAKSYLWKLNQIT